MCSSDLSIRKGSIGELKYRAEDGLTRSATEYFQQTVWLGASQPAPSDAKVRKLLPADRFMWGSDYPHDEGTGPYTREHLRQELHDVPEAELRDILGGNAAKLYGFDLAKLDPIAEKVGPTIDEIKVPLTELPEKPNQALIRGATGKLS